ncbi:MULTISPECIES: hypothetical protein [unclassified Imperialibacter]|uniref:hypothetical protein n=1 Tax=unclassified Imperialibacter TaxID=2629706 RepID=UPI00125C9CB4|nr:MULTISPECIES: hypothetical protein [unclassified Imperialibacter]CAD5256721.1 conserved hypothetical protein [Imperialibacter sp. 89]CAD5271712.1 conserved hypothetical protein [Imperialibacter sp. 75]VVT19173.1 conserved hypothetical protein [Imperialibacter sp. EC-SDR9]
MTIEEINKKVERLRVVTDAKLKFLRDHMTLLDEAFKELSDTQDQELDLVYAKIKEIEDRMNRQGPK